MYGPHVSPSVCDSADPECPDLAFLRGYLSHSIITSILKAAPTHAVYVCQYHARPSGSNTADPGCLPLPSPGGLLLPPTRDSIINSVLRVAPMYAVYVCYYHAGPGRGDAADPGRLQLSSPGGRFLPGQHVLMPAGSKRCGVMHTLWLSRCWGRGQSGRSGRQFGWGDCLRGEIFCAEGNFEL